MNNAKSLQEQLHCIKPLVKVDPGGAVDGMTRGESSNNETQSFEFQSIKEEFSKVNKNPWEDNKGGQERLYRETPDEKREKDRKAQAEDSAPLPLERPGKMVCYAIGGIAAAMAVACGLIVKKDLF